MARDPKNELIYTTVRTPAAYATNNSATTGVDLKGYQGTLSAIVRMGVQTAGDNGATMTVLAQSASTNSAANGSNISGATFVSDGNNAASQSGEIQIDPRACSRYLFFRNVISGANSPNWPMSIVLVGEKKKVS